MNTPKMTKIICEPVYKDSIGCKQLVNSLTKILKRKRMDFEICNELQQVNAEDTIYLTGQSRAWMEEKLRLCNDGENTPILLSDHPQKALSGACHVICPDTSSMLRQLKDNLERAGRKKVALYGINPAADADRSRTEALLELVSDGESIYQSSGNLEICFRSFLPRAKYYDAVICVNGYAALSLAKKLEKECPQVLDRLVLISFEEVLRHSKYNRWISLIDLQLDSYGSVAVAVSELVQQKSGIAAMRIEMRCQVCEISSGNLTEGLEGAPKAAGLLEDPEIVSMAKIEQLFRDADDLDHHIIAMLLENAKYSEIADSCYMTEGNVKYRVKKYLSICGCSSKKELLELLQEYLQ